MRVVFRWNTSPRNWLEEIAEPAEANERKLQDERNLVGGRGLSKQKPVVFDSLQTQFFCIFSYAPKANCRPSIFSTLKISPSVLTFDGINIWTKKYGNIAWIFMHLIWAVNMIKVRFLNKLFLNINKLGWKNDHSNTAGYPFKRSCLLHSNKALSVSTKNKETLGWGCFNFFLIWCFKILPSYVRCCNVDTF